jgi:hypothetical protein
MSSWESLARLRGIVGTSQVPRSAWVTAAASTLLLGSPARRACAAERAAGVRASNRSARRGRSSRAARRRRSGAAALRAASARVRSSVASARSRRASTATTVSVTNIVAGERGRTASDDADTRRREPPRATRPRFHVRRAARRRASETRRSAANGKAANELDGLATRHPQPASSSLEPPPPPSDGSPPPSAGGVPASG